MRGTIARAQSFTLAVDWCGSSDENDCDACVGTISGEIYTIMLPIAAAVPLCRTCALDLAADLAYALR